MALAQFTYVILVALTASLPYVSDVTLSNVLGIVMGIFMAGVAWRNLRATWVYHRAVQSRTDWKHVALVLGLTAIVVPCGLFGTLAAARWLDSDVVELALSVVPLIMGALTWMFPFAKHVVAKDVTSVFD